MISSKEVKAGESMQELRKYKGFLLDLDGTVYKGNERISEAITFVNQLATNNLPYLFVTNNSSKTPEAVAAKLVDMGVIADTSNVYTSSIATATFLREENKGNRVYMIGEEGLKTALLSQGFEIVEEEADYVVTGIDRSVTYEKFAKACLNIRNGARFISTNGDVAIPTERGLLPGNGSLTSVVEVSTGVTPQFIGKPEPIIMKQALRQLGIKKDAVLMIGDNYETDIQAGMRAGIDTLLVHTGVTSKEALKEKKVQPTLTMERLSEWVFAE